jgi:hypothetical protein
MMKGERANEVRRERGIVEVFDRRVRAQVTVYAAISLGLVLSLLGACVQSVKLMVADAEINMATRLSTEAVFAGYNNKLLSEFGIFAISDAQCCDEKLSYYARENAESVAVRSLVTYNTSSVSDKAYMTDNGGVGLEKQVTEYMREGGYAQIVKDFLDIDTETKKTEKINEVTAKVEDVEETLTELNQTDIDLIRKIRSMDDGSKSGLVQDICEDISLYAACVRADDRYGAEDCAAAYARNREALLDYLEDTRDKCREAVELIEKYDEYDSKADKQLDEGRSIISAGAEQLGELTGTMRNDIDDIAVEKATAREKKVNKKRIRPILEQNIEVCDELIQRLSGMEALSATSVQSLLSAFSYVNSELGKINITGLSSECAGIDIDSKGKGTGTLKNIRSTIEKGISGIVLAGMEVREGSFSHSGLATAYQTGSTGSSSGSDFNGVAGEVVDAALFNAYLFDKFPSYTDVHGEDSDGEYDNWCELNYVVEYILAGNDNDVSNLNEVILKISAVREATNFTHIVMDSAKRREALALATTLVGASGNAAAIKAAQYVIMGAWSYGESVVDVRRLMKGEKLSLVKNSQEWRLSLDNLMKMNFDVDGGTSSGSDTGKFSYEDYVGVLLLMMNQTTKNYRTMQAMELRIIALGQSDFRMKKHIYEAKCNVEMNIDYGGKSVSRSQLYSYAV